MHSGEKIRLIRTLKGFKQETMAEKLKITRLAYGDIERGKTNLSESRLKQIADVLGVTPIDILRFGEPGTNFFENCNGVIGVNQGNQHNHYDQRELQHQLETTRLQLEKQQLELEKTRLERDKAELEARYWREHKAT